jgi:hypothetical protein
MPNINEALLEMHFHSAVVNHFSNIYGAKFLRILKPVPQKECWVGFDQGWVYTKVSNSDLLNALSSAIQTGAASVGKFYLGYFLQFKVVHKMVASSSLMPSGYVTPYFRSELDLYPNKTTGISQHETLARLTGIANASVSYACGMLFDLDDIYQPPNLKNLRCVPLGTAPSGWVTNQRHFITFRNTSDIAPKWCSDPVEGISLPFDEWASPNSRFGPKALTPQQILDLIQSAVVELNGKVEMTPAALPENFTLIEF